MSKEIEILHESEGFNPATRMYEYLRTVRENGVIKHYKNGAETHEVFATIEISFDPNNPWNFPKTNP